MTPADKLDYIFTAAKRILEPNTSKSVLGFQKSPQPEVVYVGECAGRPWYKMVDSSDSGKQPIEHNFVAGILTDIEVRQKRSSEYGDRMKLRVHLSCGDISYVLVSGLGTYFSRALVSGFCNIPSGFDFSSTPVGVEASTGEKGKVVLPSLYTHGGGGWMKVKCDASAMNSEEAMTEAVTVTLKNKLGGGDHE